MENKIKLQLLDWDFIYLKHNLSSIHINNNPHNNKFSITKRLIKKKDVQLKISVENEICLY